MNAMILAAGRGTRLGELGRRIPKVLVDVGGEPLLARQLRYLERQGVERVVVNGHHLVEAVEAFIQEYRGTLELHLTPEKVLLGTAGGVRNALPLLGNEPFLVLYGDVLVDEPLSSMFAMHRTRGPAATLAVYLSDQIEGKGTVAADADGDVRAFVEKARSHSGSALVNAGIYVLAPALVEAVPDGVECDFGHDVFPTALEAGARLSIYRLTRPVIDVGTPAGLAAARDLTDNARGGCAE